MEHAVKDWVFISEIIADLYKNGFVEGNKAQIMLHDLARDLRDKARCSDSLSSLRKLKKRQL